MSGKQDELTGRVKEAAGDLTDDEELKREGRNDRVAGSAKDKVDDAKDWAEEKIDEVHDAAKRD